MHGNINDRMAEAIESCSAVMVCLSSKYKLSANCRMEAEYSNTQKKPIIPLMAEENYRPDGWLGLIISGKLWYDISKVDLIHQNISSVMSELQPILNEEIERRKLLPVNNSSSLVNCLSQSQSVLSSDDLQAKNTTDTNLVPDPPLDPDNLLIGGGNGNVTDSAVDISPSNSISSNIAMVDLIRTLFDGFERRIVEELRNQIDPVFEKLDRLENRLNDIEDRINR